MTNNQDSLMLYLPRCVTVQSVIICWFVGGGQFGVKLLDLACNIMDGSEGESQHEEISLWMYA